MPQGCPGGAGLSGQVRRWSAQSAGAAERGHHALCAERWQQLSSWVEGVELLPPGVGVAVRAPLALPSEGYPGPGSQGSFYTRSQQIESGGGPSEPSLEQAGGRGLPPPGD